jgi:hypothetical protein
VQVFDRTASVRSQTQNLQRTDAASLNVSDRFGDRVHFQADGTLFITMPARSDEFILRGEVLDYTEPPPTLFNDGFESE